MNKNILVLIALGSLILMSCGVSKKSLNNEIELLKVKTNNLEDENKELRNKLLYFKNALEKYDNESVPKVNINPTIESAPEISSANSQLKELEKFIQNDANLSAKFKVFKQGGLEKYLKISYSAMQRVIAEAKTYKGTRHAMGGLSRTGIDCSGLLYVSFQANGVTNIPRTACSCKFHSYQTPLFHDIS